MKRLLAILLLIAAGSMPANALDLNRKLTSIDGTPFTDDKGKPDDTQTVRKAITSALLGNYADEQNLTGEQKFARWKLAEKVQDATADTKFSVDELSLMKLMVGKGFSPVVVGQVWRLLDPASEQPADPPKK